MPRNKNKLKMPKVARPLKGKRLRRETRAQSRLQFGDTERQLRAERRASRLQQDRIGDWFGEYRRSLGNLQRQTAGEYSQARTGVNRQIGASSRYDEGMRQRLRREAMADANLRGVNYDPRTSDLAVAAGAQRRNLQNVFGGLIGAQGASQQAHFNEKRRIGRATEVDQLLRESARGRSINADLRALQREKGAFKVDARRVARGEERDFYLQRLAFKDKQDYQKFAANQQRRSSRIGRRESARHRRSIRLQGRISDRNARRQHGRWGDQGGGNRDRGKPGSRGDRRRAMAYLRKGDYNSRKGAIDYLINRGVSPAVARYVVRHAGRGGGGGGRRRGTFQGFPK